LELVSVSAVDGVFGEKANINQLKGPAHEKEGEIITLGWQFGSTVD
jgi:hypothetical protein